MRYVILITLFLVTLPSMADERIQYTCKKLSRMAVQAYRYNHQSILIDDKTISEIPEPLERLAVSIGASAHSEPDAYTSMYSACLNYKDHPVFINPSIYK